MKSMQQEKVRWIPEDYIRVRPNDIVNEATQKLEFHILTNMGSIVVKCLLHISGVAGLNPHKV